MLGRVTKVLVEKLSTSEVISQKKASRDGVENTTPVLLMLMYPYQAFYGLEHYNLLETGSSLIRKLNQPTRCLMSQSKAKIHSNRHLIAISSKEKIMCLVN